MLLIEFRMHFIQNIHSLATTPSLLHDGLITFRTLRTSWTSISSVRLVRVYIDSGTDQIPDNRNTFYNLIDGLKFFRTEANAATADAFSFRLSRCEEPED
jgi:hypothetical protein